MYSSPSMPKIPTSILIYQNCYLKSQKKVTRLIHVDVDIKYNGKLTTNFQPFNKFSFEAYYLIFV